MPKDRCQICLAPFEDEGVKRDKRYEHQGNFCHPCNLRAYKVVTFRITEEMADKEIRLEKKRNRKIKI